jgi:hypothetical protein
VKGLPKKDAGGIGERGRRLWHHPAQPLEFQPLLLVGRMFGLVGASEMAHHQGDVDAVESLRIGSDCLHLGCRHPEPRHAAVDLDRSLELAAGPLRRRAPGGELAGAVDDHAQLRFDGVAFGARLNAVQHIDLRPCAERLAQQGTLGQMRDEKNSAAFGRQRRGHLRPAEPVAVGLDDTGAADTAQPRLEPPVIFADGAEIDGQYGAGRRSADRRGFDGGPFRKRFFGSAVHANPVCSGLAINKATAPTRQPWLARARLAPSYATRCRNAETTSS